ncbi:hypothetical protein TSUD_359430 [Trifolium subterraneum]|uniref:Uncharacterized protein n=1 Tax=Trifolium subterraneum TaxID=3900 RepID=A0A2Z6MIU4_TRISU|nr:hypothetical protein TSUD_359430 [Trifolium subterraneum]
MEKRVLQNKGGCENGKEKENLSLMKNKVEGEDLTKDLDLSEHKEEGDGIGVNGQRLVWIVQRTIYI